MIITKTSCLCSRHSGKIKPTTDSTLTGASLLLCNHPCADLTWSPPPKGHWVTDWLEEPLTSWRGVKWVRKVRRWESPGRQRGLLLCVTSWVRSEGTEGVSRSNPVALWFCVPCFFSLSCFLAERTVILLVDFLVLLHPSVLQSVLGGRSLGAEL